MIVMFHSNFKSALCIILLTLLLNYPPVCSAGNTTKIPLHLLALVPLSGNTINDDTDITVPCEDRGEELLPAANIAADIVNSNLLEEVELKIVPVETTMCSEDAFSLTLANFVQKLTSESNTVVGVIGMLCSSAVLSVSPLATHTGIDILQITSGTASPTSIAQVRERVRVDRLFQTASPSTFFNDALISLLGQNPVTNLAVIKHTGTFFIDHDVVAKDLADKVKNAPSTINITEFEVSDIGNTQINDILQAIATNNTGIRIIYASVTCDEARMMLCRSIRTNPQLIYPRNLWVFHSHTFEDLVLPVDDCDSNDMMEALEGVLLLQHPLRNSKSTETLHLTNSTYNEYLHRYKEELNKVNNKSNCGKNPGLIHANALYDSVIAFALAINNSMDTVTLEQFKEYGIKSNYTPEITLAMQDELEKLTFAGASGEVHFNKMTHESEAVGNKSIDIRFVINGTTQPTRSIPINGIFDTKPNNIHIALPITTTVLALTLVVAHTAILLLFFYYWNSPDIKATSPLLSVVILISCYMLDFSLLITAVRYGFASGTVMKVCCIIENWFPYIGIQLIFATLLMRLFRVYRIFFYYTKLGKIWSDFGLLLFVVMWVSVGLVIIVIWMAVDTPYVSRVTTFNFSGQPEPDFSLTLSCRTKYFESFPIWIVLLLLYTGTMMVIVVLLAVKTRKVKIESFKDTRTVNVFIYTTVICFIFFMTLSLLFEELREQVVVFVFRVLALSIVAIVCVCFLFLPKIYAAQCQRKNPRKKSVTTLTLSGATFTNKGIMTTAF